jgi:1-acyl-sn-glycerol-3-phosphate acyltransferase
MLNVPPGPWVGLLAGSLLLLNIGFWLPFMTVAALLRLVLRFPSMQRWLAAGMLRVAEGWISCNLGWMRWTQAMDWQVRRPEALQRNGWYMVCANHQSWVDIFVLQKVFNNRIPLLKFFLKQELIWVPIMGLAWWALDFPFMRRHSEAYLRKHPEMRIKDLEATRRACAKFKQIPTSVMNFLEGTRFTRDKHDEQASPFRHLLRPKAGGLALALNAMGDQFHCLLDVTIVYPDGIPTFWNFLCGRMRRVVVNVQHRPLPPALLRLDYANDRDARAQFQGWVNELWHDKDALIEGILSAEAGQMQARG